MRAARPVIASGLGAAFASACCPKPRSHTGLGTHEPQMQAALREHVREGMTVYDCGANVGYSSVMSRGGRRTGGASTPSSPAREPRIFAGGARTQRPREPRVVPEGVWHRPRRSASCAARGPLARHDHVAGVFGEARGRARLARASSRSRSTRSTTCLRGGNRPPELHQARVGGRGRPRVAGRAPPAQGETAGGCSLRFTASRAARSGRCSRSRTTPPRTSPRRSPAHGGRIAIWIRQYLALPS